MLRQAVIQKLKLIPLLHSRIYQAYTAPHNAPKPYATVKFATQRGSTVISYAAFQPIEVRIYNDITSFDGLDAIESDVISALNGVEISDASTGERYRLEWVSGSMDFVDEERGMIGRLIIFEAAVLFERKN